MAEINSNDYHDYVIKNGKLIGEFEQMYCKSQDVPWHQDEQVNWLDVKLTIELLREYGPFSFISDFGSGYGYFLDKIARNCGTGNPVLHGYDISKTACKKGGTIFSNIIFHQFDLMADHMESGWAEQNRALFVLRGTLWYVYPKINNVVRNISLMVNKQDSFPPFFFKFCRKRCYS